MTNLIPKIIGPAELGGYIYDVHDHPEHDNLTEDDHRFAIRYHLEELDKQTQTWEGIKYHRKQIDCHKKIKRG